MKRFRANIKDRYDNEFYLIVKENGNAVLIYSLTNYPLSRPRVVYKFNLRTIDNFDYNNLMSTTASDINNFVYENLEINYTSYKSDNISTYMEKLLENMIKSNLNSINTISPELINEDIKQFFIMESRRQSNDCIRDMILSGKSHECAKETSQAIFENNKKMLEKASIEYPVITL